MQNKNQHLTIDFHVGYKRSLITNRYFVNFEAINGERITQEEMTKGTKKSDQAETSEEESIEKSSKKFRKTKRAEGRIKLS